MKIAIITTEESLYIKSLSQAIRKREIRGVDLALVITNKPNSRAIGVCAQYGVPCEIIDQHHYNDRDHHDRAVMQKLDDLGIDLVILAGYMRLIRNPEFLRKYAGGMINVHLSSLPKFPGAKPHENAFRTKDSVSGYTIHFVNHEVDGGKIISKNEIFIGDCRSAEEIYDRLLHESCLGLKKVLESFGEQFELMSA